jgi:hypothetical protein
MGFFQTSGILNRRGFFGGAAKAFSPTDIAGLQLWLDSTTGLFDATSGGSAVTTDGSSVARWEDQSGNGNHVTQTTSNNRPILKTSIVNSRNVVRFDGSNDNLSGGDILDFGDDSVFIGMVIKSASTSAEVGVFTKTRAANNLGRWALTNNNNSGLKYSMSLQEPTDATLDIKQIFSTTAVSTSAVLIGALFDRTAGTNAASLKLRYNKTQQANTSGYTKAGSPLNTINTLFVGSFATASGDAGLAYYNGDICEIVFYKTASVMAQADIDKIEDYLATKWGI